MNLRSKSNQYPTKHFFHLSSLHDELPALEVQAVLASENIPFTSIKRYSSCLVVDCPEQGAIRTSERAAYCRRAVTILQENIVQGQTIEEISDEIAAVTDFTQLISSDQTFLVRVYRVHDASIEYVSEKLERVIGKEIWTQLKGNNKASMKNPDVIFTLLFVDDVYLFGKEVYARKSGSFDDRRADIRPFFKPGTLEPRFARLMANLSQPNTSNYLLDPFCGPGGILLEGALMGCNVIGLDIDKRMILGVKKNLDHYVSMANYEFLVGDAKSLPFTQKISAITTDPPYGRSTSTYGKKIVDLLHQFFNEVHQVLEYQGLMTVGMFSEIPLEDVAKDNGFKLEVFEKIYIHKSLTRRVGVFRKI